MLSSQLKRLRTMTVMMTVLLFLQYELGMTTIMADPPQLPPFSFSIPAFRGALEEAGNVYFFATNIESPSPTAKGVKAKEISRRILQDLVLLP